MIRYLCLCSSLVFSGVAWSAAWQDLRQLEMQGKAFIAAETVRSGVQYQLGKADPRLRLPACAQLPQAGWPAGLQPPYNMVELACAGQGWRILLPLLANPVVMAYATTRQMNAGDILQLQDIKLIEVTNRALALQAVHDPALLLGKALRSNLQAGSLLRENQVRVPIVIKVNQPVRVVVQGAGFSIGSDAVALGNAAVGERVNVRVSSGKTVSGIVQEDLTILLAAP